MDKNVINILNEMHAIGIETVPMSCMAYEMVVAADKHGIIYVLYNEQSPCIASILVDNFQWLKDFVKEGAA